MLPVQPAGMHFCFEKELVKLYMRHLRHSLLGFSMFWLVAAACSGQTYTVRALAGDGIGGYSGDNVPATSSEIWGPHGVAVDSAGNVYIADVNNSRIRKVAPGGIITTIAGTGTAGYSGDGGLAVNAQLYAPHAVALDSAGNIYIADTVNAVIRKISISGMISTVAGNGTRGYTGDGGPAISAEMLSPSDIVMDAAANFYILDRPNHVVRKVTAGGTISTFAGTGTAGFSGDGGQAAHAQLNFPISLAVDGGGNIYIGDASQQRVHPVGEHKRHHLDDCRQPYDRFRGGRSRDQRRTQRYAGHGR